MFKRIVSLSLSLVLILLSCCAHGVEICGVDFPADSESIDLTGLRRTVNGKYRTVSAKELNAAFAQMPNLKRVDMWDWPLKRQERDVLLEANPSIAFGWKIGLNSAHSFRTDDTVFSTLGKRPLLSSANDLSVFSLCPNLLALDVGHSRIKKIDFLKELPQLKILILADGGIEDISPLAYQTEIEYLELFKNKITDISPLANLTNLQDVNLCHNDITDLSPLYHLPHLKRVWLSGNKNLSEEEVARLRMHQPNCEIVTRANGSTGNVMILKDGHWVQDEGTSWRHHPHYDTIFYIFNHGEYIDWDEEVPIKQKGR